MANRPGTPVWYELISDDPDGAEAFYGSVLGWTFERPPGGLERDYRIFSAGETAVGGLMRKPDGMPMPARWFFYLGVEDVDAEADRIVSLGGSVHIPATDIPGVGRFAFVADPQGAPFYLMRGASEEESRAFRQADDAKPGHAIWNELTSRDPEAALAFYGEMFGWRQDGAMPMGDLGDYRFLFSGPLCLGALMGQVPNGRDGWQFYFKVDEIGAALSRLHSAGGVLVQGPDQIPGGEFAVVAEDSSGARFGFVGPRQAV